MTVIFIKRECKRHPGCFTMGEECERCIEDEFRARGDHILDDYAKAISDLLRRLVT